MNKKFIVYKYTSPSGGVYIGQTSKNIEERARELGKGYTIISKKDGHYLQPALAKAIIKYGFDNFKKEVLYENLTSQEADEKEIELIAKYRKYGECYNVADGGKAVNGVNYTKIKQYELDGTYIREWDSIEDACYFLGDIKYSSNISACCCYRKHRAYGYIWRYANDTSKVEPLKPYREKICQFTKYGKYIATYKTLVDAYKKTNIKTSCIGNVLNGWSKTAGGYIWKFERECKNKLNN